MENLESDLARRVMAIFEKQAKHFECLKLADKFRMGVPDILVVGFGYTTMVELKVIEFEYPDDLPTEARHRAQKDMLQFMTMRRIYKKSEGRAFYLFENHFNKRFYTCFPDELSLGTTDPHFYKHDKLNNALSWGIPGVK